MRTKEEVQKDMEPLRAELEAIDAAERKTAHKALLGRCYRYRNSYGGGHPSWWLYAKVIGADGYRPQCFTFELTILNKVEVNFKNGHHVHPGNGWQEIPARVFAAEWRKVQSRISKQKP